MGGKRRRWLKQLHKNKLAPKSLLGDAVRLPSLADSSTEASSTRLIRSFFFLRLSEFRKSINGLARSSPAYSRA